MIRDFHLADLFTLLNGACGRPDRQGARKNLQSSVARVPGDLLFHLVDDAVDVE